MKLMYALSLLCLLSITAFAASTEQVLYTFNGHSGGLPEAGLVFDKSGNLYGTTVWGGNPGCHTDGATGCGTVFELTPKAGGGWTETVIYAFKGEDDGYGPQAALTIDDAGNLYGTTTSGGRDTRCTYVLGCGTVFELEPVAGVWEKTTLYSFGGNGDAQTPVGPVVFDKAGNLFGTTGFGGIYPCLSGLGCGTVFELVRSRKGGWAERVIHSFAAGTDGLDPQGALVLMGSSLYGTTLEGGGTGCDGYGCGTIFQVSDSDGVFTESVIYSFGGTTDGAFPFAGLTANAQGRLYGTASGGGDESCIYYTSTGCGTVFALANSGGIWTLSVIYSFTGGSDAAIPIGGVTLLNDELYGATNVGGGDSSCADGFGCGAVFAIQHTESGWSESVLWSFDGSNGYSPYGNVILDSQGNLYGTTADGGSYGEGDVFEVTP